MNNGESAQVRGAGGPREFWLRMSIPAVLLVLLLVLLFGYWPGHNVTASALVVALGLLLSGGVGIFTGARGPGWAIYVLIALAMGLLLAMPDPWRGLALVSVPVMAIGYSMGREIAFLRAGMREKFSPTTWIVAGESISDVNAAKRSALARLGEWKSLSDGRFLVILGHRRFEAWGDASEGYVVHIIDDERDVSTMRVLTRVPHQNGEIPVALDKQGLVGWVPRSVNVPTSVAEQALDGFFEAQGAKALAGWEWEGGPQAQELRFL